MSARVLSIGLASPARSIDQADAAAMASSLCATTPTQARTLERIYRGTRIDRRGIAVLGMNGASRGPNEFFLAPTGDADRGPTTAARMDEYGASAATMAEEASRDALDDAGVMPAQVTHLVTASCTGFIAPGVDAALVRSLGLSADIERTHIGFMGCHAAVNALRTARAIVRSEPDARVLVCCVEVCSVHMQYGWDVGRVVANSLFADGAGAAVVAASDDAAAPAIEGTASRLLIDDPEAMAWRIGDHGFEMTLAARVPDLVETSISPWLTPWLDRHDLTPDQVQAWAAHPGGPRVLDAVERALSLPDGALDASRAVLREHGNMSSATLLFILRRLLEGGARTPCVAAAFGPGLWAEAALLV